MTRSSIPSKRPQTSRAGPRRELPDPGLRQRRPARAHQQPRTGVVRRDRGVEGGGEHVATQHHAGPAAGRRIVDCAVAADAVLADVPRLERPDAAGEGVPGEGRAEGAREHLRMKRQDRCGP